MHCLWIDPAGIWTQHVSTYRGWGNASQPNISSYHNTHISSAKRSESKNRSLTASHKFVVRGIVHYTMCVAEGLTLHIDRNAFYFGIKHNDGGMKTSERRSQRVAYTDENNNMWAHIRSAAAQAALFKTLESCYRRVRLKYWIYAIFLFFIWLLLLNVLIRGTLAQHLIF